MKTFLILLSVVLLFSNAQKPKDWPKQFTLSSYVHYNEQSNSGQKDIYYDKMIFYNERINKSMEMMKQGNIIKQKLIVPSRSSGFDVYLITAEGQSTTCEKSHNDKFTKINYPSPGYSEYEFKGITYLNDTKVYFFKVDTLKQTWSYYEDYEKGLPVHYIWTYVDPIVVNGYIIITEKHYYKKMIAGKPDDKVFEIPKICLQ